ncbi:hypothetical protein Pmani_004121 [Petrolisthes manimaculis]|uniref:Uncharacterized protein n=1 Tax=Petrolisthes manimaculis TaxID=1843537 RepID=A0AAE1QEA5_9EUCA|nr:hypothetical protein Pmani_004121 [Petrolisthes manimaculis]
MRSKGHEEGRNENERNGGLGRNERGEEKINRKILYSPPLPYHPTTHPTSTPIPTHSSPYLHSHSNPLLTLPPLPSHPIPSHHSHFLPLTTTITTTTSCHSGCRNRDDPTPTPTRT